MILITGASRGIGNILFNKFNDDKYMVQGTYFKTPFGQSARVYCVDVRQPAMIESWIYSIGLSDRSKIILINNAGINYNSFAHKADINHWADVIQTNLTGSFNVIREVLPYMRKARYGRVINISSVVGQKGVMGTSAYAASKAGLWGMTRAIAVENALNGITINNINLGYVNAGITINEIPQIGLDKIKREMPTKKLIEPDSIYRTILYLIGEPSITGTSIDVNGGMV